MLTKAYKASDWLTVGDCLSARSPTERLCGAEINSIACMMSQGFVPDKVDLCFFHSATDHGRNIVTILKRFYRAAGHRRVKSYVINGLQDQNARQFRTTGLRNLARKMKKAVGLYSAENCAINATGGFKAQIVVAVLVGQKLNVPVYYKHERFDEIISFPPSALDQWLCN